MVGGDLLNDLHATATYSITVVITVGLGRIIVISYCHIIIVSYFVVRRGAGSTNTNTTNTSTGNVSKMNEYVDMFSNDNNEHSAMSGRYFHSIHQESSNSISVHTHRGGGMGALDLTIRASAQ
jgi:hypothetical protein